jgi:hypothetical protein
VSFADLSHRVPVARPGYFAFRDLTIHLLDVLRCTRLRPLLFWPQGEQGTGGGFSFAAPMG